MRLEDLTPEYQAQVRRKLGLDTQQVLIDDPPTPANQSLEEKELQRLCEQELTFRGIEFIHLSFRAREKKGWPDLVFCVCGKPYAVELKTLKGKLTVDQSKMMIRMERNGWHTAIIRSYDAFRELLAKGGIC